MRIEDPDIDEEVPLLAGRTAVYTTTPHGWVVSRVGREATARKGRLVVYFGCYPRIDDSESYVEDDVEYGAPRSADEAARLASLWSEAEEILAAYEVGEYSPPFPLRPYVDRRTRAERGTLGLMLESMMASMQKQLNRNVWGDSPFSDPLEHRLSNVWRRMQGKPEDQYRPPPGGSKFNIVVNDEGAP